MLHHKSLAALLTMLGTAGIALLVQLQPAEADPVTTQRSPDTAPAGDATPPNAPVGGIVVNESAVARDTFSQAITRERQKDWAMAGDLYQKLLENFADRMVPVSANKDGLIDQYTSVANAVRERLCHWPREGLDVYCRTNEPKAAALLETARKSAAAGQDDSAALDEVVRLYFVTESAKAAALRLIDEKLDRGDFLAAALIGDELLSLHPNLTAERPAVLFHTALAYRMAGDPKTADERAATLAGKFPNETGVVRGKLLAQALGQGAKPPAASLPDSWLMPGGNPQRDRVPAAHAHSGLRMASISLAKPDYKGLEPWQRTMLLQQADASGGGGETLGVMPTVDRGELFFQDGTRVYAVSLETGAPLSGWVHTWGADRHGQYVLPGVWGSTRSEQQAITLTDHQVLAELQGRVIGLAHDGIHVQGEARLVCLDRESGKENWVVAPSTMKSVPKDEDENAIRALQLSGSPLVVGNSVLVIGRTSTLQGEDCYVLAFDLSNGQYRWGRYVAGIGGFNTVERTSHLAYADGRVYVLTNLGAVAALDASNGMIVWLDIYPTGKPPIKPSFFRFSQDGDVSRRLMPWMANPVVVHDGKLFVLPIEGDDLLIYDAATGHEEKRIDLDQLAHWDLKVSEQPDKPTTLVGIIGEKLVLAGESRVLCLDWQKYDQTRFPGLNDEMIVWPSVSPLGIRGRCFMTTDAVIVPGADRVRWLDLKTGAAVDEYPRYPWTWDDGESAGNVVVSGDSVVVAGASTVNIYTEFAMATAKLDRDIAASPNAAAPQLRYAEVMYRAGHPDAALSRLNEALKLMGGYAALLAPGGPSDDRDRLFNDALTFAGNGVGNHWPGDRNRVLKFFDFADRAAYSPAQKVNYRIARVKLEAADPQAVVKLYQEILADPQMRDVSLPDMGNDELPPGSAADMAESAIDNLIRAHGPEVYSFYQWDAEHEMTAALKLKGHPEQQAGQLLSIAQTYPNSTVARQAMLAAADDYESAAQPLQAVRVLRQLAFKYPRQTAPAAVAAAMARNYLAMTDRSRAYMLTAAAERLALAASQPGDPKLSRDMTLPDGRVLPAGTPLAKARDEVRAIRGIDAEKALPDLRLPVPPTANQMLAGVRIPAPFLGQDPKHRQIIPPDAANVLPGVSVLLAPQREFSRVDRVVAWGAGAVTIFAAGQTKPLFSARAFPDAGHGRANAPTGVAWADDTALVWGLSGLIAIDASPAGNGKKLWDIDMPRIAEVRPVGDRALVATSQGRLLSVDIGLGRIAWQKHFGDRPIDRLVATEDFTVAKFSDGITCNLIALDTYSGRVLGTTPFPAQAPQNDFAKVPVNLALSAGGTLVYTMPDRLCLKDLYKPWNEEEKMVPGPPGQAIYLGASQPGQLFISGKRVLAVADDALGAVPTEKWVRVHSLETGEALPLKYDAPDGSHRKIDLVMAAETREWDVLLRVVGPHVYVIGPNSVFGYNLDKPDALWKGVVGALEEAPPSGANFREAFCGQHDLVVLQPLSAPSVGDPTQIRLRAFSRRLAHENDPNSESGRCDYAVTLTDPAGIQTASWQACDGGFYYATDDGKVHMLRGARQ